LEEKKVGRYGRGEKSGSWGICLKKDGIARLRQEGEKGPGREGRGGGRVLREADAST